MNPEDNRENLPAGYIETTLGGMSAAKRKRFKEGEWANDQEGVLWNDIMLDRCRVGPKAKEDLVRVVVGVDPSGSQGRSELMKQEILTSNDIGIIVAGIDRHGIGYILEDCTVNASPGEWGAAVKNAALRWGADKVVAEKNYGGAMVEFVLKTAWPTAPIKMVDSSRGKALRAEPVAALYEDNQLKVKHAGAFPDLEDQMAAMMPQPIGFTGEGSPDRLDAAVFALTELMLQGGYHLGNLD
jgi:phage terminase large subunit-like protein